MILCNFEQNVETHKTKKNLPVSQLADNWLLKNEQTKERGEELAE
jgi:hypothetical protein